YDTPISIAGTHGKTTTTAMVSEILMSAGGDPTISIGGVLKDIGGNFRIGADKYFVMEACEYTNSYHSFYPRIGVILNVEADHLDFFKDIDDIRKSFNRFAQNIPDDGVLVINADIEGYEEVVKGLKCRIVTFGKKPTADWHPLNLSCDDFGRYSFETEHNGKKNSFKLGVYGTHNVLNALAAIAVANELGIGYEAVEKGLRSFTGTDRRFEIKGELNGFTIIDDYAHHPTEIAATIEAAKKYPHRDLWIIFQSHTYTRTKALMDDFADVLSKADHVISAEIYPARETDNLGISGKTLADEIRKRGTDCYYFPTFEEIKKFVRETLIDKDLLITMGAGDVVKIADELLSET
nr:UDP-N-acetylmuramate--L-alanine ligase [Lachnospiraceae bacterium]